MAVLLKVRFAPDRQAGRPARTAGETFTWVALGAALVLLSLLTALGCTSGGGPAPAATGTTQPPPYVGTPSTSFLEANGGDQKSGDATLDNQAVFSQDLSLKVSTSADGTLQNESGYHPSVPPGGI